MSECPTCGYTVTRDDIFAFDPPTRVSEPWTATLGDVAAIIWEMSGTRQCLFDPTQYRREAADEMLWTGWAIVREWPENATDTRFTAARGDEVVSCTIRSEKPQLVGEGYLVRFRCVTTPELVLR